MELKFSEMTVDTSLAKEYLNKHNALLELYNDYDATIKRMDSYWYNGKMFHQKRTSDSCSEADGLHDACDGVRKMAASLKKNANLIAQLEYYFRNVPIEVTNVQLNLLIQYMQCYADLHGKATEFTQCSIQAGENTFYPDDSLLMFGRQIHWVCKTRFISNVTRETVAICHLFFTLLHDAGFRNCRLFFSQQTPDTMPNACYISIQTALPVKGECLSSQGGVDSGTVAVVSDDADVDSAVDKLVSVSKKAPWRLRRILVQESVYQQFKDALSWKCNLKTSGDKPQKSDVLCSDTLTYNDIAFLVDPVQLVEENPSVVTVEAYRTTKEMISLVQQDKTRYLSLWTNGIAEINEVTHATKSPVVWVNNVADFRGPPQVSEAVFAYTNVFAFTYRVESDRFTKLSKLSQSWLKLDVESRRDILCTALDKYIVLSNENEQLTEIRDSLLTWTPKSFVDVGKDYVCMGMSQPLGLTWNHYENIFCVERFQSILQGNALVSLNLREDFTLLEQAGVPVLRVGRDEPVVEAIIFQWSSGLDTVTRVVWTNSGTTFAN